MINKRLFDHYNINTEKNLNLTGHCNRPFDTIIIDKYGSCYACECQSWLPQSIGNLQVQTLNEILNSSMRKVMQSSIKDKSYRYCNEHQCSYIRGGGSFPNAGVFNIRLAIDDSCNLSCPSCRTHKIFVSRGHVLDKKKQWIEKIFDWMSSQMRPIKVTIGSDGDPFASLLYRHFMTRAEQEKLPHLSFDFQTNGLLIKKMYQRHLYVFDRLKNLHISVDGANKETYEALRRGGSWEMLNYNLQFLAKQSRQFRVEIHMVVQEANWREMPKMLALVKEYGFDRIYFNIIRDWNTGLDITDQTQFTHSLEFKRIKASLEQDELASCYNLL